MTTPNLKRPRGRPKDISKQAALLDAARRLLLSKGPEVSVDEIASVAGVSKSTIYANFQGKDDLVEAVIRREADRTITQGEFDALLQTEVTADTLVEFGRRYVGFINSHDLIGWDRVIASLDCEGPELPGKFFDLGPGRGQRFLERLLDKAIVDGLIHTDSTTRAADQLTGLWLGFSNLEVKLGIRPPLTVKQVDAQVATGVAVFLRYYGAKPKA
ncbi:TetR/AcrR family transcriptional regulator [Albibacillus kandeliae]|uniref:TetR/AcrR family transcriptional regulator n=1 Tax=Albibacillus kandeliae TaxID=2174228 RepID=UPI000D69C5C8|nr:TetR/AcrR family transcriptional regulator [Albibacillus kandeliae]